MPCHLNTLENAQYTSLLRKKCSDTKILHIENAPMQWYELWEILRNEKIADEPLHIPTPYEFNPREILEIMPFLSKREARNYEIGNYYGIGANEASKRLNAGRYFGLIERVNEDEKSPAHRLTYRGQHILSMDKRKQHIETTRTILRFRSYHDTMSYFISNKKLPDVDTVIDFMLRAHVSDIGWESTAADRARAILKTIIWILTNTTELYRLTDKIYFN